MIIYDKLNQLSQFQIQKVDFHNPLLSKFSKRDWKIVGIALIVFAFLGLALYQLYRWSHKVNPEKKDDLPSIKEDIQQVSQEVGIEKNLTDQVIVTEVPNNSSARITFLDGFGNELKSVIVPETPPVIASQPPPEPTSIHTTQIEEIPGEEVPEKTAPTIPSKVVLTPPEVDIKGLFEELKQLSPLIAANLPYTYMSCQFPDIPCPQETHVKIDGQTTHVYLHANDVKFDQHHYIATQYPRQKELFWLASKECSLIVDLTNGSDMTKGLTSYAPPVGESFHFGEVIINCQEKAPETESGFNIYSYQIQKTNEAESSSTVSRLHYTGWPDHHGIAKDELDRLTEIIKSYRTDSAKPIIIHCRAGVGRTGTIIVACEMKKLIEAGSITQDNLLPTMKSLILEGRRQRGPYFVQTPSQVKALWEWSWWALERQLNVT